MKNKFLLIYILHSAFLILHSQAQTLIPKAMPTAGGYFTVGGNSLSWTIGETFYTTLQNGNIVLTQGEQQPYIMLKILNLKAFIEGFYLGGGQMQATLYNNYPLNFSNDACDSVMIMLHDSTYPYNFVASSAGLLHIDGSAVIKFPKSLINGVYYISLHHRNGIETWSKNAVSFNSTMINFDFTKP